MPIWSLLVAEGVNANLIPVPVSFHDVDFDIKTSKILLGEHNKEIQGLKEIDTPKKIIKPKSGWQLINFKELVDCRDLFYFLVWRDIKVLYAQTILGFLWAIRVAFIQIVIFSIIFGKVAKTSISLDSA